MSETIISKTCTKCKQHKNLSQFHKSSVLKGGYQAWCKPCAAEAGRKYEQTAQCRNRRKRYHRTERGKQIKRTYAKKHPDRKLAHHKVEVAINKGVLPKVCTLRCTCGNQARHYHHHNGYSPEHWLDAVPLCRLCHVKVHKAFASLSGSQGTSSGRRKPCRRSPSA